MIRIAIALLLLLPIRGSKTRSLDYWGLDIFTLEAASHEVSAHCDVANDIGYTIFHIHVRNEHSHHTFINRRGWPVESCRWRQEVTNEVLRRGANIKISGTMGSLRDSSHEYVQERDIDGNIPPPLGDRTYHTWVFEKVTNGQDCYSYFEKADCQVPEVD